MTHKEVILNYLREKGKITTLECMQNLKILDLQKPIQLLRQEGYNIKDKTISKKNIYGSISRYKEYFLEE